MRASPCDGRACAPDGFLPVGRYCARYKVPAGVRAILLLLPVRTARSLASRKPDWTFIGESIRPKIGNAGVLATADHAPFNVMSSQGAV